MADSQDTDKLAPEALITKFQVSKLLKQGPTQPPHLPATINRLKEPPLQTKMADESPS